MEINSTVTNKGKTEHWEKHWGRETTLRNNLGYKKGPLYYRRLSKSTG